MGFLLPYGGKMKLVLVAIDSKFIHSNLALRYLRAHGRGEGREIVLKEFTVNDKVDNVTSELYMEKGDVYVFSFYIWNISFNKMLMDNLRLLLKEAVFLIGGPEVSHDPVNSMEFLPCDYLMEGEGEELFPEVLRVLEGKKKREDVLGLYYREGDRIFYTGRRKAPKMEDILFPYEDGDLNELSNRILYYEAQRGCPYRCSYCLSSIDKNLRKRPLKLVYQELDWFINKGIKLVKFVDRTFNMDDEYSYSILQYIKHKKEVLKDGMVTSFHVEISGGILTDRTIDLLRKIPKNLVQIEAGIQSTNSKTLHNVNRLDNFKEIDRKLRKIIEKGRVHVHTDLILGLPGDGEESFIKSFNDAMDMEPDTLQVGFLKVLKGTEIYKRSGEYCIDYRKYPPYEVLQTRDQSYEFLIKFKHIEEIVDSMWNSNKYDNFMRVLIRKYDNKFELFLKMANLFTELYGRNTNLSVEKYNRFSIEFIKRYHPEETGYFADLLRLDHMIKDRSGWIPDILEKYNYYSRRVDLEGLTGFPKKLKGTVSGYKISLKGSKNILPVGETYFWYSLQTEKIFLVDGPTDNPKIIGEYFIRGDE